MTTRHRRVLVRFRAPLSTTSTVLPPGREQATADQTSARRQALPRVAGARRLRAHRHPPRGSIGPGPSNRGETAATAHDRKSSNPTEAVYANAAAAHAQSLANADVLRAYTQIGGGNNRRDHSVGASSSATCLAGTRGLGWMDPHVAVRRKRAGLTAGSRQAVQPRASARGYPYAGACGT